MSTRPLDDAFLDALRAAVGREHVILDGEALDRAATATYATNARSPVIVRPASREEVQACFVAANRFRVPLYPTSCGKNWGFGSRVPSTDGCALLDLGRMNRILELDEELAFVTVEPGVTFGQLHAHLDAKGSRLFTSTIGAGPHASVLANAIERGDGSGPLGDRWSHVSALEVVLPTGELIHTGSDRAKGDRSARIQRWASGPALDGLFSQSSLGVVTRMTLWLTPRPRALAVVRFSVVDPERLAGLVDACRELRLEGTLRAVVGLWNDYRVLSTRQPYPWDLTGGATPLRRADLDRLRDQWGGASWFGSTAVYAATPAQARASVARIASVLKPRVDHLSVDTAGSDPAIAFAQGVPHEESLRTLYWRKRMPVPASIDPDRDRCGAIWTSAAVPFRGRDARAITAKLETLTLDHGFEPMLVLVGQTDRALTLVPLIIYDRDEPGADDAARRCHHAITAALVADGLALTRLGVGSMDAHAPATDDSASLLSRLKELIDPNGVLAPGRYDL